MHRADYRVLLVEDEMEIAEMLALFFEGRGYALYHAFDGEEALTKAATALPHVILMDITLPDMDGYTICRRLRQQPRTSHIPIIFLTRRGSRDDRLAGLELGADDFISKPFDIEELMLRIRNSVLRAARDAQTDPRTGLPSARALASLIEKACANPSTAMLQFTLENAEPFRDAYGAFASGEVSTFVANLISHTVHELGHDDDFIGYLDDNQYVALCHHTTAEAIAERVTDVFNYHVEKHYNRADLKNGVFTIDGVSYPLMTLVCHLFEPDQIWNAN